MHVMTDTTSAKSFDIIDSSGSALQSQHLWTPNSKKKWQFDIDLVGSCNLTCPSCPVGNLSESRTQEKYMRPELLDRIIRKGKSECRLTEVNLYNWTEPFLHPNLPEMIRIVRSHKVRCGLSTNLNLIRNIDGVMEANPDLFKVSLSGFTQETYGKTHRGGDIEIVKRNMAEVALAKRRAGGTTALVVAYHRYLGNHEDENAMKVYAESLGYEMEPAWAFFMPLEKMLAFVGSDLIDVELYEEDQRIIDSLALPLGDAVEAAKNSQQQRCDLRERRMAISANGVVTLCCASFDQSKFKLGSYIDTPINELQEMKYRHNMCNACMHNGLHVLFTYNSEEFDDLALRNVIRHYPDCKLKRVKLLKKQRPRGIRALPFKLKREFQRIIVQLSNWSR